MKKLLTIFWLCLISFTAFNQPNIEIYLTNQPILSRGFSIESTEEKYDFDINDVQNRPIKIIRLFDKTGSIVSETRFGKAGGKLSETKWEYTVNHKLLKKTHKYFLNMLGWKIDETLLNYNDTLGSLSEIIYIKNRVVQSTSKVFCDSSRKPIEVRVLDDRGAFSMIEKVNYSTAANIIRVILFKPTNQFVGSWIYPIDPSKQYLSGQIERQYYLNGEVMLESLDDQTRIDAGYYYEYNYDVQGNWIEKSIYQVTVGRNNKIKDKKLSYSISRIIKYY